MKTIAIDCRFAGTGTGLSRYTSELVGALLARRDPAIRYILLVRSRDAIPFVHAPHTTVVVDCPHYSIAEQTTLPAVLRSTGASLAYFPHFNAPFFCPLPFVATVHDLILHRYPGEASLFKRLAYRVLVHRTLRRARAVIAVSEWTKRDVAYMYGRRVARKTVVVGEGVHDSFTPPSHEAIEAVLMKYALQRPYFLYVGNCKPHKNVEMLLEAFTSASVDAELVLVSGGREARSVVLPPHVRLLEGVPNADLPALYGGARSFVTASLEEGYCLPIVEALACGCPVIATNRSAIPEVVSDHGMLIEPTVEAFRIAFMNPPSLPTAVRTCSWDDAATDLAAVLTRAT